MGLPVCSSKAAMRSVDIGAVLLDLPYPRSAGVSPPHMPNTSCWPSCAHGFLTGHPEQMLRAWSHMWPWLLLRSG